MASMATDNAMSPAQKKLILLCHAAVVVLLVVFAGLRLASPDMKRPFDMDEVITVQYYTWTGIDADGEGRTFRHIDDYYTTPAPSLFHLLMGTYCAMGRWPEPNNHIPNSLLVNFAVAVGPRNELTARLSGLLGGLLFAGLFYYYCGSVLRWRFAAPLAFLWAWFVPHIIVYSQAARGYSWMLALQPLLLICASWLARKPASVGRGLACAIVAVVTLLNVVSMSVDWLLPVYAALLLVTPAQAAFRDDPDEASDETAVGAWRKNLILQLLGIGGVGFMFFMSHLPSIFSSARQYGLAITEEYGFFSRLTHIFQVLFPTAGWMLFALAGALGLLLLLAAPRYRFLAILVGLVLLINCAHVLAAGRFPYERTMAHFIPLVMLGTAHLVEVVVRSVGSAAGRAALWGGAAALTALLVWTSGSPRLEDDSLTKRLILAQQAVPSEDQQTYLPFGWGMDYLVSLYGPRAWNYTPVAPPAGRVQICLFPKLDAVDLGNIGVRGGRGKGETWNLRYWEVKPTAPPETFPYSLACIAGRMQPFSDQAAVRDKAIVFWYPDLSRMGISAKAQKEFVDRFKVKYLIRDARQQAKLDIYSILQCFLFIAETKAEYAQVADLVREGIQQFGGYAVVFVPDTPK